MRSAKIQISQRISAVWSDSWLSELRNSASLVIQDAPNEDSDQTESSLGAHVRRYASWRFISFCKKRWTQIM